MAIKECPHNPRCADDECPLVDPKPTCVCAETSARNCPVHSEPKPAAESYTAIDINSTLYADRYKPAADGAREWRFRVVVTKNGPHTIWDGESLADLNMVPGSYHVVEHSALLRAEAERDEAINRAADQMRELRERIAELERALATERGSSDATIGTTDPEREPWRKDDE